MLNSEPTRRDFLKTGSALSLGAVALGSLSKGVFAADGDDTIRVGLVGCGGRGSGAAAQALSTEGNVKLVAMGDAFADQVESSLNGIKSQLKDRADRVDVDEDHKFAGFDAYQQVINSDVDLVILATPPGFRPIHFEAAIAAGKHVFMEKPVATDAVGVRKVLAAAAEAKAKNLKVGVGLQRHHEEKYLETIKRIKDGEIGDIRALRVYWNGGGVWDPRKTREEVSGEMEYQMRNWYYYNWLCGDHICEQHIHNLDVGNWIKDAYPVTCHGMGGRQVRTDKKYGEIFDHFAVEYTYADGTKMFSQCRHIHNCWNAVTEHAIGSTGVADVHGGKLYKGLAEAKENETYRWRNKDAKNPYQVEHDDLFRAIRENTSYNEAENGAYSTLTSIMGRMATYSGKEVSWEDALNSQISLMPEEFSWEATPPVVPLPDGSYPIPTPGVTRAV
ncbi:MAG: Gfo/Idh/MocA family oxidoreductase [Planctomycetaceae bacterium]|nr:Gfo/Idh/MocA family oxidoreductase [Planctomycetaceae bacterium]